jgi:hypothetical protein
MKRWFSVLLLCLLLTAFALAATPQATLTPAKWWGHRHDSRVQQHHAHKAGKHHTPKRASHHGA